MLAHAQARNAYQAASSQTRPPRNIEYDAIAKITRQLMQAAASPKTGFPKLAAAVHDNQRLWTVLAVDVAGSDNGLPKMLRAQIVYLAEFTHKHSRDVLAGRATAAALIEINTAILKGLRATAGEQ